MPDPIVLYSANTWLAYKIAEMFYKGNHFVWCSPYFDSRSLSATTGVLPPTSSPGDIYHSLYAEVKAGDRHSAKVRENREGISRGAEHQRLNGVITVTQEDEINEVVEKAAVYDFRPVLYVIPYRAVAKRASVVPVAERAHPAMVEYIIRSLPRRYFDVIEIAR